MPELDMQFNHFLVRDEAPLLFHAGLRGMFPLLHEAVSQLIDPASLRSIAWSHFESDECGALNDWLAVEPDSEPVCSLIGKLVNADAFAPTALGARNATFRVNSNLDSLAVPPPTYTANMTGNAVPAAMAPLQATAINQALCLSLKKKVKKLKKKIKAARRSGNVTKAKKLKSKFKKLKKRVKVLC